MLIFGKRKGEGVSFNLRIKILLVFIYFVFFNFGSLEEFGFIFIESCSWFLVRLDDIILKFVLLLFLLFIFVGDLLVLVVV